MSWKLRRNANNASTTGVLILFCVIGFIFFPKVTIGLILIFLILQFWDVIFDERFKGGNSNSVNNPENINKIYKQHKKNDKYKLNRYKFDLQKTSDAEDKRVWNPQKKNYDPNTLGAFTGDPNAPSASDLFPIKDKKKKKEPEIKKGKRGGRYTEDKTKDGRPYRRYF